MGRSKNMLQMREYEKSPGEKKTNLNEMKESSIPEFKTMVIIIIKEFSENFNKEIDSKHKKMT